MKAPCFEMSLLSMSGEESRASRAILHRPDFQRYAASRFLWNLGQQIQAVDVIARYEPLDFVEHSERIGKLLLTGLRELQERHEIIKDVRGKGLMLGFELRAPSSRVRSRAAPMCTSMRPSTVTASSSCMR